MARPVHALLSAGDIRPLLSQPGQRQDPEALVWGPGWGLVGGDRLHAVTLWERRQSGYGSDLILPVTTQSMALSGCPFYFILATGLAF